jgi:hypothetical protein
MATKSDDAIKMQPVVLSGELEKRGGSHKSWKKRFFVLSPFGIGYKPGEKDTKFIRILSLSGAYPVPSPTIDIRRPYCFVVMTIERDFNLVVDAGSQENMVSFSKMVHLIHQNIHSEQQLTLTVWW